MASPIIDTNAFRDIIVDDYQLFYNKNNRPLYYDCQFCNSKAMYQITRTSNLTDNTDTIFICDSCLDETLKKYPKIST